MHVSPDFTACAPELARGKAKEMLSVMKEGAKTVVRINSSSLGIILACPRKSYYSLHRGLKSRADSAALIFGTAIHKALEVFYSYPRAERNIPANFKEVSNLMAFQDYGDVPARISKIEDGDGNEHFLYKAVRAFVEAAKPLAVLPDDDKHSIPSGIWTLQEYFKTYIQDPYVVYVDAEGPVAERTKEAVLFESATLKIILFGTIDVVLQNEANGTILPADHKTFSQGHDFFNRLKPNHQYTGYLWLAQQTLGITSHEFMVNGLQKKPRPKTSRGTAPHFTRQVTTRSPEDMTEFFDSVRWAVESYLAWHSENKWPLGNVNECTMYGGCQFLDVCQAPQNIRENMIDVKFVTEKEA